MTTQLSHGTELRNKVLEGVNTLADYVAATLGPKGQNVMIQKPNQRPFITKDGVTVAQSISLEDPHANAGAEVVKQVSAMTNAEAGDGTTTSTVLAREIINSAHRHIVSGVSPIEIKRGLEKCLDHAVILVKEMAKPISSEADIHHIATISANNDVDVGKLVATAVTQGGKNGSVTIEEARSHETSLELAEGFSFDSGYAASAFVNDERRDVVRYDEPMFLITDAKIDQVNQILPALEISARESRPLVIVADEIEGQALAALIMNTVRGTMKVAAVKAPRYGEERRDILSDMSIATGAKFFQQSNGDKTTEVSLCDFGQASSVEMTRKKTTIVNGAGKPEEIDETIEKIQRRVKDTEDMHEAKRHQNRITRLSSGVARIMVGASSEVEMIEKRHRIEDALEAVRSAQQEGIVAGGGTTLLKIATRIAPNFDNEEQAVALVVFKKALQSPFRLMASNSGMSPDVTMWVMENSTSDFEGYNFLTQTRGNLLDEGIIDPAKVTRCALKNAISVAATLLLTNHSVVTE